MVNKAIINEVSDFLKEDPRWETLNQLNENWADDPTFSRYHKKGNKEKGVLGEYYVENIFKSLGAAVVATRDSEYRGTDFDMVVDGFKTEVKFSLANSTKTTINVDRFIINHVAVEKNWDRLVFCGINPLGCSSNRVQMYFCDKKDFEDYINPFALSARATNDLGARKKIFGSCVFKPQQGGLKTLNDDYICTNFKELVKLPFFKNIELW
jgi:hypothetical protein